MPDKELRRLTQDMVKRDQAILIGIQTLGGYHAISEDLSCEALSRLGQEAEEARLAEIRAQQALVNARNTRIAAERALHERLQRAKQQVLAQYGKNFEMLHMLGLKRAADHRRPARRVGKTEEIA